MTYEQLLENLRKFKVRRKLLERQDTAVQIHQSFPLDKRLHLLGT